MVIKNITRGDANKMVRQIRIAFLKSERFEIVSRNLLNSKSELTIEIKFRTIGKKLGKFEVTPSREKGRDNVGL